MFECPFCAYRSTRESDLHRHLNRKTRCDQTKVQNNREKFREIIAQTAAPVAQTPTTPAHFCDKCHKQLANQWSYARHHETCRGHEANVCPTCTKRFSTYAGRSKHMRNVKCSPPPPPPELDEAVRPTTTIQHVDTINHTHHTTNNIDNSQHVHINVTFGKETLDQLCRDPNYTARMEELIRLGKYAIPQQITDIFFNENFPMNNTIMKQRHNDRFVKVKTGENQWDLRAIDDVYKTITSSMETYMSPYFKKIEQKMGVVYDEDPRKFRQLTRSVREFGHKVLWLDWLCDDIRLIGVDLNEPYCENERNRRIQEMKAMLLEHIYDKTREMLMIAS